MDRHSFLAKYPDRSKDGLRFRRAKLNNEPVALPVVEAPDDGEADGDEITPDQYDKYFSLVEQAVEVERNLGTGVDFAEYEFQQHIPIAIAFTSDWHLGAGGVEYGRLRSDLELIRDTAGAYAIFNGDCIENTKTHSKSASALYSAAIPKPRHQLEYARRMGGILPGEKWLAWCEGNHDAFDYRAAGVDRIAGLAEELGAPYFREKGGTIKVTVGGQEYVIVVKHQYKGQSQISKANSARRLQIEWPHYWDAADIVALAHLHEPDLHITQWRDRDVYRIRSGTYKTHDAWAEAGGYRPTYGVPVVILYPGERKILAFPGERFVDAMELFKKLRASALLKEFKS